MKMHAFLSSYLELILANLFAWFSVNKCLTNFSKQTTTKIFKDPIAIIEFVTIEKPVIEINNIIL